MNPHDLPVYQQKDKILSALSENRVVVVESPTGSGKTTQLPIILHEAGFDEKGVIGVTQPRRIAALSVSDFIARQMGQKVSGLVGYKMRFEDRTSPETKIKIMTDGILLQEMKLDPFLSRYNVIMVDEAHERSLNIDFILGLLKKVLEARSDFKVIVSSATINAEVFSEYFGECPIVKIDTQTYPVTLIYDPIVEAPREDPPQSARRDRDKSRNAASALRYSDEALYDKVLSIVDRALPELSAGGEAADEAMLIFLPGEKTIKECAARLAASPFGPRLHIQPLYARLGKEEQEKVFDPAPAGKVKVIISTNIAETSVTIDGVTVVIDSGLAKLNYYNPKTFTSSLIETPIAKASCNQRKGRAGRTRPGVCYRLFPRKEFENRPLFTTEEIYRTDLSEVVLRMAELGISDFENFDFISKPARSGIAGAIDVLNLLGALDEHRMLSTIGQRMCLFPLIPRLSRMIVEAVMRFPDVIHEVLIAASFLSTMSPYVLPPGEEMEARRAHHGFRDPMGDFVSYLKIYRAFMEAPDRAGFCYSNYLDERTMREIARIHEQLSIIVSDMGVPILGGGSLDDYLCAVSRGLIQFVCARQERGLFRSLTAEKIQIHPGSVMFRENPDYIVAGEIVRTTRMYAMSVSPLPRRLLSLISPLVAEGLLSLTPPASDGEQPSARRGAAPKKRAQDAAQALARDFTDRIKIGSGIFPLERDGKKRKKAVLVWEDFKKARESLERDSLPSHKGLGAVIQFKGSTLLDGEKLDTVLRIADWLDLESDLGRSWPRGANYSIGSEEKAPEDISAAQSAKDLGRLVESLDHVMQVASSKGKDKRLGFVALYTDGHGEFWYRVSKGFHTALNESIASLESLADLAGDSTLPQREKERIGALYRKLTAFFD